MRGCGTNCGDGCGARRNYFSHKDPLDERSLQVHYGATVKDNVLIFAVRIIGEDDNPKL